MSDRRLSRGLAAVGAIAAGAGGVALAGPASPAAAFTGECAETQPAATLVADGVCEVRITALGASTFTPPTGILKLSAVLVGGGGGANLYQFFGTLSTGGGGGSVVYIDSLPLDAPLEIAVGAGGAPGSGFTAGSPGGQTTAGADAADGGDDEGSAACGDTNNVNGGGAQSVATGLPDCAPGAGYLLSQIPGVDSALFPADADGAIIYGQGGAATGGTPFGEEPGPVALSTPDGDAVADDGSGTVVADDAAAPVEEPVVVAAAVASDLPGAGGASDSRSAAAGSDGIVILRFAAAADPTPTPTPTPAPSPSPVPTVAPAAAPTLPATGAEVPAVIPAVGAGALGLGGILLLLSRRRRARRD